MQSDEAQAAGLATPTALELLAAAAFAQQRAAEDAQRMLHSHIQELDGVVRDEIRRTMVDELLGLTEQCRLAVQSLRQVERTAVLRFTLWSAATTGLCLLGTVASLCSLYPSQSELAALRSERVHLQGALKQLRSRGAAVVLRRCEQQLCVRIDPKARAYGAGGEYRVLVGSDGAADRD